MGLGRYLIMFFTFFAGFFISAHATHVVGGELTYKCLGNNRYEIRIDLYVDCMGGDATAIEQDNPAKIGIFDAKNSSLFNFIDSIYKDIPDIEVPRNFNNNCINNPPPTCLRKVTFRKQYTLPPNANGYRVVYVRCCRNSQIANISGTLEIGATYYCEIPPVTNSNCNNSAFFKNYPPQIICINNPLVYDHSATDIDGDSLSYEFCNAYPGGEPQKPKPDPSPQLPAPITNYIAPYSAANPMVGFPIIKIYPVTGVISGTPNTQGRFVVSVCCHEWRNGVLINTVKREFQFVVTNCSKAVVANIPQFSDEFNTYIVECKSKTVNFVNYSSGGFAYDWDFGVPGATSKELQPIYTYPDTGVYTVKLIVNKNSTCPDSISRIVKIYPDYYADFTHTGLLCPSADIQFNDLSDGTFKPVVSWEWNFGDGTASVEQNPTHRYTVGGEYNVQLISKSIKGCIDTNRQEIGIERFYPFAGDDTIIVKGEYINFRAQGGVFYKWTPADRLSFSDGSNPRGYYPDTGRYGYNVFIKSVNGCEGEDSINVLVVDKPYVYIPSALSPNGDGWNDKLRPYGAGYSDIKYFRVFNRFGELVFKTDKFYEGWDGTYKGQMCDLGTYFWILNITNRFGKDEELKGDVTLIR